MDIVIVILIALLYMFMSFAEGVATAAFKDWKRTKARMDLLAYTIATGISGGCVMVICYLAAPYFMRLY